MKIYNVAVVGAGAAGLFFGSVFNGRGQGIILEGSNRPGLKILMSGGGACNLTHSGDIKDFCENYFEKGKKIRSCLYKHSNLEMMDFIQNSGLPLITREDGKVFPKSMDAEDMRRLLVSKCRDNGFQIRLNSRVLDFREENGINEIILEGGERIWARHLVIATGGKSYPVTGSDGSMLKLLKEKEGLKVTELKPSLGPIYVKDYPYGGISGVSLKAVTGQVIREGKVIARQSGDLLFTDGCFSGPLAMHLCRFAQSGDTLSFDYICPENIGQWRKNLNVFLTESKKNFENSLAEFTGLPKSLAQIMGRRCSEKPLEAGKMVTADRFTVERTADFKRAMTTAGGIDLGSVDLKTMRLKNLHHVYAIGEILDVDGKTGGYNLQFAYSSAATAACAIEKELKIKTGLIGHPISESLSPFIQEHFYRQLSIDGQYELFDTEPKDLEKRVKRLKKEDVKGFNVTIPYKERIIEFLDGVDIEAEAMGAVNTVVNRDGKLIGYNTDCDGFIDPLLKQGAVIEGKKVIILGAGGAAKAVAYGILRHNPMQLAIFNRHIDRAEELKKHLEKSFTDNRITCHALTDDEQKELVMEASDCQLLINTTPVGNYHSLGESSVKNREVFHSGMLVVDLVYRPYETEFIRMAEKAGCQVLGGISMLVRQAALSFAMWTDQEAEEEQVLEELKELL